MGFFKKLKERLFKSSSKIDEGLDAIIEDGGEAEEVELEEQLKTQKETTDYATNDQADIESVVIEPQLEQSAPTTLEYIKTNKKINLKKFKEDFEILSILRNLKIIGIFTRLAFRDDKKNER